MPTVQQLPLKLLLFAGLCALPLFGAMQLLRTQGYSWLLWTYPVVSVISFCQYGYDKNSAQQGRWRIAENTLQITALLGGWPGALLAQQAFRHKTRKFAFQLSFWLLVLVHQGLWSYWLFFNGQFIGAQRYAATLWQLLY